MFPAISTSPALLPRWKQVSGSELLAVDLSKVKEFVNRPLEDDTWDDELTRFTRAAQRAIEQEAEVFLTPCKWVGSLPAFLDRFRLVRRPFINVEKIEYVAPDGTITLLPTSNYLAIEVDQMTGMVYRSASKAWPGIAQRPDAIRVTVVCGYARDGNDVDLAAGHPEMPEDMLHALFMTIASLDNARGDMAASGDTTVYAMKAAKGAGAIPQEARKILQPYRYMTVTI